MWFLKTDHPDSYGILQKSVAHTLDEKQHTDQIQFGSTVKLGNKERFDKEQIGIKEPFLVTNLPFTS